MDPSPLDVIVADGGLGSLLTGYLLAARGRRVGIVKRSPPTGTTTVSVVSAGRLEPLRDLIDRAPIIGCRSAVVLQPEGGLSVGLASERFGDAAHAVAVVERSAVAMALIGAIQDLGGRDLGGDGSTEVDSAGVVAGVGGEDGMAHGARCTVLDSTEVRRLGGIREEPPQVPAWALETEWHYVVDPRIIRARFSVAGGGVAEWWLFGDPFDGAGGFGRVRAFDDSITLGVVMPLDQVLEHRVDVDDLGERIRAHPFLAPLVDGGVLAGVSGSTFSMAEMRPDAVVGDGWVLGPAAHPFDAVPLSTEIAMAEVLAEVVDGALSFGRVTSARLSALPKRLGAVASAARLVRTQPLDAWADGLVTEPTGMVDGLRAMAARFAEAG